MGFRLKTSMQTKEIFEELGSRMNLKPFALCKLAISMSLTSDEPLEDYKSLDNTGLELNRQTITAQYDGLFKALLEQHAGKSLTDDEYFPTHAKLHIDRGAVMLKNKYNYSSNLEHFIKQIINNDISI
ncbi:DNA sulfur modification protein DndE [Paraclostridium benzoelyticum]|uniref:DNA sulfur modification protein DndE n=1 Tax=Paraclostridium benzoelyticum TaxID=1629550 RepID=A0A0M3DEN7_9FIRM|nr:DndE family protein [Paraclostridium benzoelyticum]KKY00581.1 DNA sulfur modification protein DndE [Paraclostridium benzoelyticum]